MTPGEEYLKSQTDSLEDVSKGNLLRLDSVHMLKLRPFVHTFLKEASQMFEMYIYTMAGQSYATEIAQLLDHGGVYFSSRVISRADCTEIRQKGLDVVLVPESATVILDDTKKVWQKHVENLIVVYRYHYFASSCRQFGLNCKSLSELNRDEAVSNGVFATILRVLKQVYQMFFDQVLKRIRQDVLKGCNIVFSQMIPTNFRAADHRLWKLAESLGAMCTMELHPSATHVVSKDTGSMGSKWALQNKKHLVHPQWLRTSNCFWRRLPETDFALNK